MPVPRTTTGPALSRGYACEKCGKIVDEATCWTQTDQVGRLKVWCDGHQPTEEEAIRDWNGLGTEVADD